MRRGDESSDDENIPRQPEGPQPHLQQWNLNMVDSSQNVDTFEHISATNGVGKFSYHFSSCKVKR